jgi:hypothetical protein
MMNCAGRKWQQNPEDTPEKRRKEATRQQKTGQERSHPVKTINL